jgi:ribosomal protein S30
MLNVSPKISPDGKILFFNRQSLEYSPFVKNRLNYQDIIESHVNSPLNGGGDIWGISTKIFE